MLICVATPIENRALASRLAGKDIRVIETGMGARRLGRSAWPGDWPKPTPAPSATTPLVLSAGLAGGLQPGLRSGDLVADLRGLDSEIVAAARTVSQELGLVLHLGALTSSDRVLTQPEEKRQLGIRTRALAVDMESMALREFSRGQGAEFAGVRTILDPMEERLPGSLAGVSEESEAAAAALRDWTHWPKWISIYFRQKRALANLARFIELWHEKLPRAEAVS